MQGTSFTVVLSIIVCDKVVLIFFNKDSQGSSAGLAEKALCYFWKPDKCLTDGNNPKARKKTL